MGSVFKHVKHEPSDGRPPIQYRIQLVDKSLINEAASFMVKYFYPRENLNMSIDERFGKMMAGNLDWIAGYLSEGISLAAVLEDDKGGSGALIGCNVLFLKRNDSSREQDLEKDQLQSVNQPQRKRIILQTMEEVRAKVDIFERYNCSSYIDAEGLVVAPEYEGRGIGAELLRARAEVCRITRTPVCATVFTGAAAQKTAHNCGYECLSELDLNTYRFDGDIVYSNPKWPLIKWMAKCYF